MPLRAIEANEPRWVVEQALRGYMQAEVERLGYKRILLERGDSVDDEAEKQERLALLRELKEKTRGMDEKHNT